MNPVPGSEVCTRLRTNERVDERGIRCKDWYENGSGMSGLINESGSNSNDTGVQY